MAVVNIVSENYGMCITFYFIFHIIHFDKMGKNEKKFRFLHKLR